MVRSRQSRIKNYFAENRLFAVRSVIAGLLAAALLIVVGTRLFYLQVLRHDYYSNLSQGNRIRTEPIPPSRGLILDRHGVVLADNLPAFQIELVREQVGDTKSLDATLASLVGIGLLRPEEVSNIRRTVLLHKVYESVPIKLQLTEEEMALFAVHRYQFSGVDIRTRLARHYPLGTMAVHAIGYVSAINEQDLKQIDSDEYAGTSLIGKLGVEAAYEQQLHGKRGSREILVNAAGRPVDKQGDFTPHLDVRPPVAGDDLILGLDIRVQKVAEEALAGKRGSVVALDPKTGDVIALASMPGFDPNGFVRGLSVAQYGVLQNDIDIPLLNRALRGAYPPGSTVKPLYALAALKYNILSPQQPQFCGGFFSLPGSSHQYRDDKKHGFLNMRQAIAQSCDVYFYRVAERLGIDRMAEFMKAFGYGALTGIDIPGEKAGLYASPEWKRRAFKRPADQVWFGGETISMGIGQGAITVTPLQQAHFAAEIAERGRIIATPRLVSAMRAAGSNTVVPRNPRLTKPIDIATAEQWDVVYDGMVGATGPGGTAYASGLNAKYKIAGKTGTAQVFTIKQNENTRAKILEERRRDHAWFIAYAPADDPKIAISVLVENGGFGASAAAPIARKVLDAYLLGIEPPADPKKPVVIPSHAVVEVPAAGAPL
ncbi:MAG: penicillin-binding protein 2 [Gammaproteobacteria bacterium]|jgi:penicillin-binding protein 2|nr:penicillin-binding protein 2 [Gammaproteobacteria bacterium]